MVIDTAIPGDRNVIKREAEKILKYTYLITEIQCTWNVRAKVITGVTETISKSLGQYLSNIPRKYELKAKKKREREKKRKKLCTHTTESANVKVQNIISRAK